MAAHGTEPTSRPRVLLVGTEDVDMRIELMEQLRDEFILAAAGTRPRTTPGSRPPGSSTLTTRSGVVPRRSATPMVPRGCCAHTAVPPRCGPCLRLKALRVRPPRRAAGWGPRRDRHHPRAWLVVRDGGVRPDGPARHLVRRTYEKLQQRACQAADLTIFQNQTDADEFLGKGIVPRDKWTIVPGSGGAHGLFDPARSSLAQRRQTLAQPRRPRRLSAGDHDFSHSADQGCGRVCRGRRRGAAAGTPTLISSWSARRQPQSGPTFSAGASGLGPRGPLARASVRRRPGPGSFRHFCPAVVTARASRVLLEAASMGLPMVTTRSPGCSEVVEDGVNGYLVPVRDAAALSSAVDRLAADAEARARFGAESRRRAITRFNLSVVTDAPVPSTGNCWAIVSRSRSEPWSQTLPGKECQSCHGVLTL